MNDLDTEYRAIFDDEYRAQQKKKPPLPEGLGIEFNTGLNAARITRECQYASNDPDRLMTDGCFGKWNGIYNYKVFHDLNEIATFLREHFDCKGTFFEEAE